MQLDIKATYLNTPLDKQLYVIIPPLTKDLNEPKMIKFTDQIFNKKYILV